MKLIVGLGNPGKEYENTRHNIGFMVLDNYLSTSNINWQTQFEGLYTSLTINNEKVIFLKPQTFMNLSGNSVQKFVNYYKISLSDILVIHDDLDLPIGTYRLKINSSSGGHNGIKSLIEKLNSNAFARLKIGISKANISPKDYVLGKFSASELQVLKEIYPILNNIINSFLVNNIDKVMSDYNGNR